MDQAEIDIKKWLDKKSDNIKDNVKVVTAKSIGQDFMLRIDKVYKPIFDTIVPPRAGNTENKKIHRVCVSPNLLGCLIAYNSYIFDFQDGSDAEIMAFNGFKGGYILSKIGFEVCLYPNEKLVPDSPNTLEHWLVNYDGTNKNHILIEIGKCFIKEFTYVGKSKNIPSIRFILYLEHNEKDGIYITHKQKVGPGYYKIAVNFENKDAASCKDEECYNISKVGRGEYLTAKNLSAALLSYKEPPKWLSW